MTQKTGIVEMVQFRLREGVSEKEGIEALTQLNDCIKQFEGFISRKLSKDEEGNWLDLVYWTDKQSATAAGQKIMQAPEAQPAFKVVDKTTMLFRHYTPELTFDL